ncbi:RodZ domain-containing protein [Desulfitobacterium sp.]|uniref:RodZ domain-containing protein n=1 Tax=Desulfitobacterium sp. TaxID=49981 RepID=UPI002B2134DA|nr:RodZ domain-containing protein [Desulfitobacterium sp.]MEA4901268.1 DUF4115 domain-containing protein [Desulfitobacterium sp.]
MAGEGKLLQAAREEKGWSLIQAEDITKIRVRYLEAMENEDYRILPGATYVKGFLRTYSKYLGINPEDVLELYKESQPVLQPKSEPVERKVIHFKRPVWFRPVTAVLLGFLALGTVAGIAFLSNKPQGEVPTADYTPVPLPSAPQTEPKSTEEVTPAQPPANTQTPANVVEATSDGLKAQIVFTQTCWLVVNVDGKPALEGTFSSGTTKELTAAEKIEFVTVGNAGGVTITLNGKSMPSLGASGQVVRNVVFNKETLNQVSAQIQTAKNP